METKKFTKKQQEKLERLHFLHIKFEGVNGGLSEKEYNEYRRISTSLENILPF